jgi:hypothetical protein
LEVSLHWQLLEHKSVTSGELCADKLKFAENLVFMSVPVELFSGVAGKLLVSLSPVV